jgi:hypothetical protein
MSATKSGGWGGGDGGGEWWVAAPASHASEVEKGGGNMNRPKQGGATESRTSDAHHREGDVGG